MRVPADANLDELKKKARRRLVGAVVLALAAAVFVPMLLESDERPLGDDVSVRIPPVDQGKFVNGLNASPQGNEQAGAAKAGNAKSGGGKAGTDKAADPRESPGKPDTTSNAGDGKADDKAAAGDNNDASAPANDAANAAKDAPTATARAPARSLDAAEQRVLGGTRSGAGSTAVAPAVASKPEPAPAVANKVAAPKPAASAAVAASPPARGGFVVQLAAFSDDKGANALANRLKRSGHPAFTEPVSTTRGTLWRVRVGPYPSREDANAARDKLKREGQNGIVAARTS